MEKLKVKNYPSLRKLQRIDSLGDRRDALQSALDNLLAAEEYLHGEDVWLYGSLLDMINEVQGLIRQTEDSALEAVEGKP